MTGEMDDEIRAMALFQSLFSWKYHCDSVMANGIKTPLKGCNPCFLGSTTVTWTAGKEEK